jgi:hypothetical protein
MPQARCNTTWVEENKLGKLIGSVSVLLGAVACVLSDLSSYKLHVQQINNQAVFEVVTSLGQILGKSTIPSWAWSASAAS